MKKNGILNKELNTLLASLGHTDTIVIADCGLPIPNEEARIDLALVKGFPPFLSVLDAVINELVVEEIVLAEEIKTQNPDVYESIKARMSDVPIQFVRHEEFKEMTKQAKAVIRTGEATPYANIILRSGVNFS
ncbi:MULTISPECIES: D-ribose pyranase [Geobacillus]|jgi:D-ribose pyranase|uniref:D-ribose pyranase n=2 Tax=Geobacillus thermodenitrificans TaxID=33940 RepID=RBSD_GEOTN|nr:MULTISPECIES: D-ribose pyranase [Geobacillus]A4IT64.1 RecName: Full=D-ribose pyranase [Geobacillus thermodenitrificans NG80-2]ABO68518.1 High affinity ribose transport protein RbsD [Geobacillus thermodenitrificans NG80-2]ARA98390.1 D-ribose pyranase [Geobacillus thermodenitrificans]ARP44217.1 D-ribose pyranase [Geobacillus thermodenitrificans]ATO37753.1 D-ribose pyranase [Geobacillus thermodenitrificans]KQB91752.1 D-ribose pyranase [Geobacillus sp. PA-3]